MSSENKNEVLYYPVAFKILDPEEYGLVPVRMDGGMYYLRAPRSIHLQSGDIRSVSMGISIKIPDVFEIFTNTPGVTTPMVVHAHLDSLYDTVVETGVEVLAPKILSPAYNGKELKIVIRNSSSKLTYVEKGTPLACIYFTATPPILFGENNNI